MTVSLIMSFLRHLSEEDAFATLERREPWLDRIEAVGLDSSEVGHPPSKFARVFAAAHARGLSCVAHAGEEGPPDYVYEALDLLAHRPARPWQSQPGGSGAGRRLARTRHDADRVPAVQRRAAQWSTDIADHPIDRMLRAGLRATVNSDDPAYFGGYIARQLPRRRGGARACRAPIWRLLARNSFLGSFLPDDAVAAHLAALDAYVAQARMMPVFTAIAQDQFVADDPRARRRRSRPSDWQAGLHHRRRPRRAGARRCSSATRPGCRCCRCDYVEPGQGLRRRAAGQAGRAHPRPASGCCSSTTSTIRAGRSAHAARRARRRRRGRRERSASRR